MRHDKAAKLMRLARVLAGSRQGLTLDEIAAEMEVGRRTAERMRDALDLAIGLEAVTRGIEKRFRVPVLVDAAFRAPTAEEMGELELAIAGLAREGQGGRAGLLGRLKEKIEASLKPDRRRQMEVDVDSIASREAEVWSPRLDGAEDDATVALIRTALREGRAISFAYVSGSNPGARRTETPLGLLYGRKTFLLAAGRGDRGPVVQFRVDRMQAAALEEATSEMTDFDVTSFAAQSFGVMQNDPHDVELKVRLHAATDAARWRFHPNQSVERHADGSLTVRFRAAGMQELAWHIMTWGTGVEVVKPARLKEILVDELWRCFSHHTQGAQSLTPRGTIG